jgi:hypothetical protein
MFPEAQQQYRQFARDGDDGPFVFPRTAGAGKSLAVTQYE